MRLYIIIVMFRSFFEVSGFSLGIKIALNSNMCVFVGNRNQYFQHKIVLFKYFYDIVKLFFTTGIIFTVFCVMDRTEPRIFFLFCCSRTGTQYILLIPNRMYSGNGLRTPTKDLYANELIQSLFVFSR